LVDCGGTCIDPLTDRLHCGAGADCTANPGVACGPGELCNGAGGCDVSCHSGLENCGNTCVNTVHDPAHCGTCFDSCSAVANAQPVCVSSDCAYVCDWGYADCNLQAGDGCEINVRTDVNNCGFCGNACLPGVPCSNGVCGKIVFVSSTMYDGNMGGLAGADAECQALAAAAGLTGTYLAWLSDWTGTPASRFVQSAVPYRLVDGTQVAVNWTDLVDGSALNSQIGLTETGGAPPLGNTNCGGGGYYTVYTNTAFDGTMQLASNHCSNWSSTTGPSVWGLVTNIAMSWTQFCNTDTCAALSPIYCFEQ
jgi:hypothetical protein